MSSDINSGTLQEVKTHGVIMLESTPLWFILNTGFLLIFCGIFAVVLAAKKEKTMKSDSNQ